MDVGKLFVTLGLDVAQFERSLKSVSKNMEDFGKRMDKVGKDMSMKVTLPLTALATGAVMTAGKFEQLQTSMEVLTGSAEEGAKAFARLQEFSAGTPFQLSELAQANNTLMGFGMNADEAFNSLRQLGDIAAISGANLSNVSVAFGQSAAAGRVMTQDLNQFINNGIPVYDLLAEVTGKNVGELRDLASQGAITFDILQEAFKRGTSEGGKFFGGMEKQSKTINGLFSTLKDNVSLALGELGNAIVTTVDLQGVITGLVARIQALTEGFKNLSPNTQKFILVAGGLLAITGPLLVVIGKISLGLSALSKAMLFMSTRAIPAMTNALRMLAANPAILAITGLTVVIAALVVKTKASTLAQNAHTAALNKQKTAAENLAAELRTISTMREEDAKKLIQQAKTRLKQIDEEITMMEILSDAENTDERQKRVEQLKARQKELFDQMGNGVNVGMELAQVNRALDEAMANASSATTGYEENLTALREEKIALTAEIEAAEASFVGMAGSIQQANGELTKLLNTFQKHERELAYAKAAQEALADVSRDLGATQDRHAAIVANLGSRLAATTSLMQQSTQATNTMSQQQAAAMFELADNWEQAAIQIADISKAYLVDALTSTFAQMGANLASGVSIISNVKNIVIGTLADLAIQVGRIAIGVGVAVEGIKTALKSLNPAIAIVAGAALIALGGAAKAALARSAEKAGGVPAFADGGIVSGPTLGIMGEYAGARSNPEVIAPLNKLQSMMGGVGGEVTFRIEGRELVGILSREGSIAKRV